ncbi:hypothetical protein AVEN_24188-1, partial [Araneus ventricosus]
EHGQVPRGVEARAPRLHPPHGGHRQAPQVAVPQRTEAHHQLLIT